MQRKLGFLSLVLLSFNTLVFAVEQGEKSPSCTMEAFISEQMTNVQQYYGQVVYLDFWASWCPPCAKSFPFLNTLHHDFQDQGLVVIGVNLDEDMADANQFLQHSSAQFLLTSDQTKQCAKDFNVRAMPSSYLIDRNGVVRYVHLGFRSGDRQRLRDQVQELLAEPVVTDDSGN